MFLDNWGNDNWVEDKYWRAEVGERERVECWNVVHKEFTGGEVIVPSRISQLQEGFEEQSWACQGKWFQNQGTKEIDHYSWKATCPGSGKIAQRT